MTQDRSTTPPTPEEIMELVDDYADAFHAAMRPDGGIQYADGLVAKGIKDKLRAALSSRSETPATCSARLVSSGTGTVKECPPCGVYMPHDEPCIKTIAQSATWRSMLSLPRVTERTELLFRKEWSGRDGKVRAMHEVLYVWPDGVLTDHGETVVAPEEMPTHWAPLPASTDRAGDHG